MTDKDQTDHFANEVDNIVERYRSEYDMSYAAAVGVLQMKIYLLCDEAQKRAKEISEENDAE